MSRAHDEIRLLPEDFHKLRELFNQHCGFQFGPEARLAMERRLRERVVVLGLQSFGEYYAYLRHHQRGRAELDEAIDAITVNETYFFREDYQLRALKNEIVPMLVKSGAAKGRLQIWSAGCSTGEEVYSIAMIAREAGLTTEREVRIFGSDISRRCVIAARRGVYGASAFRVTPPEIRRRYFEDREGGARVVDDLRALCQFGHLNLLDAAKAAVVGRVDVIFCRNVLIYLDEQSRRRVIETFYERLLPGGFLLLGHSESLVNVSTAFELVHLREDLVYRKPAATLRLGAMDAAFAILEAHRAGSTAAAPAPPADRGAAARPGPAFVAPARAPGGAPSAPPPEGAGEPGAPPGPDPGRAVSSPPTGAPGRRAPHLERDPELQASTGGLEHRARHPERDPEPQAPTGASKPAGDTPRGPAPFQKPSSSV